MQKGAYEEFTELNTAAEVFVEIKAEQAKKDAKQAQKEANKKKRHGKKNRGKGPNKIDAGICYFFSIFFSFLIS